MAKILEQIEATPIEEVGATSFKVFGETVPIKPLAINQWFALTQILVDPLSRLPKEKQAALANASGTAVGNIAGAMVWLQEDVVVSFFATMSGVEDRAVRDHFNLLEAVNFLDAMAEVNDLEAVWQAFLRLGSRFKSFAASLSTVSPSSPATDSPNGKSEATPSNGSNGLSMPSTAVVPATSP